MMGMSRQTLFVAGVATALLAAPGFFHEGAGMAADTEKIERTVSVSATGSVAAEPDIAQISAGVVTEADTAKDAIGRNSAVMSKLIDGLKAAGVSAKDIQTRTLNVEPRYTQPKDGRAATINGYRVLNQVRLTVREVKRLGDILDQAIALGANQINSIAFDVSNMETLKDAARKLAMENARRRGELYAKAAGGQLGPVLRVAETVAGVHQPVFDGRMAMRANVPIEAGTRDLEVEIHVTYALR
jgi:uncharacterized protein YggE